MTKVPTSKDYTRKAQLALGVAVICVLFLVETVVAHNKVPSAASPVIWSVLVLVALGALALAAWYRHRARSSAARTSAE